MRRLSSLQWLVVACALGALASAAIASRTFIGAHFGGVGRIDQTELRYPGRILVQAGPYGVVLRSSGSTVTLDKKGNITIQAAQDITVNARGDLYLTGDHIKIDERYPERPAGAGGEGGGEATTGR